MVKSHLLLLLETLLICMFCIHKSISNSTTTTVRIRQVLILGHSACNNLVVRTWHRGFKFSYNLLITSSFTSLPLYYKYSVDFSYFYDMLLLLPYSTVSMIYRDFSTMCILNLEPVHYLCRPNHTKTKFKPSH